METLKPNCHPNGFLPIKLAGQNDSAWNLRKCDFCGGLMDFRARTRKCRTCRKTMDKVCPGCGIEKPRSAYWHRSNGEIIPRCKDCRSKQARRPEIRKSSRERRRGRPRNWKRTAARLVAKYKTDEKYSVAIRSAALIRMALRIGQRGRPNSAAASLLGCTVHEFRHYVERQWAPGMSWGNYGRAHGCWSFDHKRPIATFNLLDETQRYGCFHFSNYQPMWCGDNSAKKDFWDGVSGPDWVAVTANQKSKQPFQPAEDPGWRAVPNCPNYEAHEDGRICRLKGGGRRRVLKGRIDKDGYRKISVSVRSSAKGVFAHAMVCSAFHGPRPSARHTVAHWDGAPLNNSASNLRWATPEEQWEDRRRHGRTGRRRSAAEIENATSRAGVHWRT